MSHVVLTLKFLSSLYEFRRWCSVTPTFIIHGLVNYFIGLEEVMEFLEESFPEVEIAIAHGKVIHCLKWSARSMTTSLSMGKIQNYKAPNHYVRTDTIKNKF